MTRDRLAALADAHGRSLGDELAAVLDELTWLGIEAGYDRLAGTGAGPAGDQAEADAWLDADLDALAAGAADEYPEFNGG
jgi:hypothetical protein